MANFVQKTIAIEKTRLIWAWQDKEDFLLKTLEDTFRREAQIVLNIAKATVARGDGTLEASLATETKRSGKRVRAWIGVLRGSPAAAYMARIEFGFNWVSKRIREDSLGRIPFQEPQPFMRPAIHARRPAILKAIRQTGVALARHRSRKVIVRTIL